ncbi:MAG: T9SS type A sorting domain-containing protein [bacterium]
MKSLLSSLLAALTVFFLSTAQAQVVQTGWRIASEIKAADDLIGAWEVIAGYDLDKDGKREFFFTDDPSVSGRTTLATKPWTVYYYENTGDNTYEKRWSFQATVKNGAARSSPAIAVGDVDKDNLPELYFDTPPEVTDNPPSPKSLYVFEFDGANFPTTPSETWNLGVPDNFLFINSGIAIGDVDNDNEVEIILQSRRDDYTGAGLGRTMLVVNSGGIDIGLGLGAFQVEYREMTNVLKGGAVYDPRILDYDRDGKPEIWVFTFDMFSLAIYEATGPNTYAVQTDINRATEPADEGHRRGMRFYDANGDGKLEMYTTTINGDGDPGSNIYYIGSTDNVASLTKSNVVRLGGYNPAPGHGGSAVGDIDGDGLMDFLYAGINPENANAIRSRVYRMEYKGTGSLADSTSYDWSVFYEDTQGASDLRNIAIDDLDGDNKMDVLITNLDVESTNDATVIIIESESAVAVKDRSIVVTNYALHQNYPNPFNPTTKIAFDLPKSEQVTLSVYNLLSRKVETLVDQRMAPGAYEVTFNAARLPSGIYYYTIEAGKFKTTKKMVLAK